MTDTITTIAALAAVHHAPGGIGVCLRAHTQVGGLPHDTWTFAWKLPHRAQPIDAERVCLAALVARSPADGDLHLLHNDGRGVRNLRYRGVRAQAGAHRTTNAVRCMEAAKAATAQAPTPWAVVVPNEEALAWALGA